MACHLSALGAILSLPGSTLSVVSLQASGRRGAAGCDAVAGGVAPFPVWSAAL